jgi:hypothetical protein
MNNYNTNRMNLMQKLSFTGYLLVASIMGANGIIYLFADKVMPYHAIAMGYSWDELAPGIQIMSLNFMKAAGTGFLTTSIALLFLLFFPFRKAETWSYWAIFIVATNQVVLILIRVVEILTKTQGRPPLLPQIIMAIIILICFALSLLSKKLHSFEHKK